MQIGDCPKLANERSSWRLFSTNSEQFLGWGQKKRAQNTFVLLDIYHTKISIETCGGEGAPSEDPFHRLLGKGEGDPCTSLLGEIRRALKHLILFVVKYVQTTDFGRLWLLTQLVVRVKHRHQKLQNKKTIFESTTMFLSQPPVYFPVWKQNEECTGVTHINATHKYLKHFLEVLGLWRVERSVGYCSIEFVVGQELKQGEDC